MDVHWNDLSPDLKQQLVIEAEQDTLSEA